jgi:hypothetical protein
MLKTIVLGEKNSETIAREKSYAEILKSNLPAFSRNSWKQVSGSGAQIAQYVFFTKTTIKFGHEDGKSTSVSTRTLRCCFNLLENRLERFARSISKKTSCDEFSNLAEYMFKILNRDSDGLAFQCPNQMNRLKMIEAVTKFILDVELHPLIENKSYLIYKSSCGSNSFLVWNPNLNGQCIGLILYLEPVYLDTLSFENLFIVNRHIIYIPSENANRFRSYSFCSRRYDNAREDEIGSPEEDILTLACLLFNKENPSQQHEAWGYIFKIIDLWYAVRIQGFTPFIPRDKIDDVLILITKMASRKSNVIKDTRGNFIAKNEDGSEEFVYDWELQQSDLVLRSFNYFDHKIDGTLSEISTRPSSPAIGEEGVPLQCVMNSLLKKTDNILNIIITCKK